jgi:hypothetical protein
MHPTVVSGPHGMVPFAFEQNAMTPGMAGGQPTLPGMMHPSMMPHPMQMQSPSMTHGYPRQPSGTQGPPYPMPMADTTNMHFNHAMPPQNIDSRRPVDRHYSQQYGSANTLYDPYDGNSPAFKISTTHHNVRKYNQNNFQGSSGLERKTSATGSRPYHGSLANDKPSYVQQSGNRLHGVKRPSEDDSAITQDYEYGCHINWIGPQNTTVTEVFVRDLPEDIRDAELEALFHNKIGVKPKSINAKAAHHPQYYNQGRKHAFVG